MMDPFAGLQTKPLKGHWRRCRGLDGFASHLTGKPGWLFLLDPESYHVSDTVLSFFLQAGTRSWTAPPLRPQVFLPLIYSPVIDRSRLREYAS